MRGLCAKVIAVVLCCAVLLNGARPVRANKNTGWWIAGIIIVGGVIYYESQHHNKAKLAQNVTDFHHPQVQLALSPDQVWNGKATAPKLADYMPATVMPAPATSTAVAATSQVSSVAPAAHRITLSFLHSGNTPLRRSASTY